MKFSLSILLLLTTFQIRLGEPIVPSQSLRWSIRHATVNPATEDGMKADEWEHTQRFERRIRHDEILRTALLATSRA